MARVWRFQNRSMCSHFLRKAKKLLKLLLVKSKVNTYWQSPAILWEVTSYFLISDVPMTAK